MKAIIAISLLVLLCAKVFAQRENIVLLNDSIMILRGLCKNISGVCVIEKKTEIYTQTEMNRNLIILQNKDEVNVHRSPYLSIHGNVAYNFNYQSYLDTPYMQNDIVQQSVQTRLNFTLKQQYPFSVFITHRNSNSPYFINATDISLQFKQSSILDIEKKKLRKELDDVLANKQLQLSPEQLYQIEQERFYQTDVDILKKGIVKKLPSFKSDCLEAKFDSLYTAYKNKKEKVDKLDSWLHKINHSQEIIEEKEKQLREEILSKNKQSDTLINDSLSNNIQERIATKKNKIDTAKTKTGEKIAAREKELKEYQQELNKAENKLKQFQKKTRDSIQQLMVTLNAVKDLNSLQDYLHNTQNDSNRLSAFKRLLLSVKQIGIGRTWIDYSDLTVKNVSLNGLNVEMNPRNLYLAAAIGKVNYRFRDFIVKGNDAGSSQSLALVRFGYGQKDNNNVIFTYYTGQKALLNQKGVVDSQAVKRVTGFSVESKMIIDAHNSLVAEYARSAYAGIENKMLQFRDRTSEALGLKLLSDYQKTNTKVEAYFRKIGEDFQSFTLNPTNSNQDAFAIKIRQGFLKRKLTVDASIKKNDFNSPLAAPNFSNSTVFKSLQLTMQIPKYPYLSVGYYPSTQVLVGNNNLLYENQFNTLNAVASHSYILAQLNMNTNIVFTKFFNKSSDSNFLYSNSTNLTVNQSISKAPFVFQTVGSYIDQTQFTQVAVEPILTYQLKNILSVTASAKWNRIVHQKTLWGSTIGVNILLKKIGTIEMQYTKTYLPSFNNNLLPVNMGRITFNKEF